MAIGNVAKVDAVTKANIANINGLTLPSAAATEPYLAYSVRKLGAGLGITYSGPCMRVRRTSDNVEADVEFDGDVISLDSTISNTTATETTFGAFVGHGGTPTDAKVHVWYDQSSTGNNMEWKAASFAYRIYSSSTGLDIDNGQPTLNGAYQSLTALYSVSAFTISTDNNAGYYWVGDHKSSGNSAYAWGFVTSPEGFSPALYLGGVANASYTNPTGQFIASMFTEGNTASIYVDSSLAGSNTGTGTKGTASQKAVIGARGGSIFSPHNGNIAEFLFYRNSAISERSIVENNINGFFQLY